MNDFKIKEGFGIFINAEGRMAAIMTPNGAHAYYFEWREERGTYELLFEDSAWEDLFKTTPLIRDYLDLVLSTLISYRQRVDCLLK